MKNLNLETRPTGRSPKGKYYFGENTEKLCKDRPNECQIGNETFSDSSNHFLTSS